MSQYKRGNAASRNAGRRAGRIPRDAFKEPTLYVTYIIYYLHHVPHLLIQVECGALDRDQAPSAGAIYQA